MDRRLALIDPPLCRFQPILETERDVKLPSGLGDVYVLPG
jgi:hypothetical protein